MKKLYKISILIVSLFVISHSAYADTSISHICDDGGLATAVVNISKNSFSTIQTNFTASGQIQSTCSPRNMNLTVRNNDDITTYTLIPEVGTEILINPGIYPQYPRTQTFQSPTAEGIYNVHFELGVNEPEPLVDLCPDATNPNPAFVGVQNPLPAWAEIRNGLCKIKISADVVYQCVSGRAKYTLTFDRPVPDNMMIYVSYLMKGPFNNPPADHLAFTSTYYNFQFEPVTTNNTDGYGTYINLTKGMTSYITPYPKLSTGPQEDPYQSTTNEQQCLDAGSLSYARTSAVYFKVSFKNPDYVTDFRLKNYTGPVSGFHYANQ